MKRAILTAALFVQIAAARAESSAEAPLAGGGAPAAPAPLGVIGADPPAQGRLSVAISSSLTRSQGSLDGQRRISPAWIVTMTPWFLDASKPVRLVPLGVSAVTESLTLSYGVTRDFGLSFTAGHVQKHLDAETFAGASGIFPSGKSHTATYGLSDFSGTALWRVYNENGIRLLGSLGVSFPTGGNANTFTLLLPDGTYGTLRAFYAMQPGVGTFDLMPGLTFASGVGAFSFGASYRGRFPLAANAHGYRWGDFHEFNGWLGYALAPGVTATARLNGVTRPEGIRGWDREIRGRSQSSDPNNYGGRRLEIFGGATVAGSLLGFEPASIAIEAGAPIYHNLNGPQLARKWQVNMALRLKI